MYRILVVDDEPMIVEGVCNIIEENNPWGLEIYKACLGIDALRILETTRMDIVITDIRMPAMSGIELMGQIRREWPHCKIIFLTAFEEFDYAYAAAKDGGARFLLKTEGYAATLDAVGACVEEIDAELRAESLRVQAEQQRDAIRAMEKKDFLREILYACPRDFSQERLESLGRSFQAARGIYLLVGVFADQSAATHEAAEIVRALLNRRLPGKVYCEVCMVGGSSAVWAIQPAAGEDAREPLPLLVDALESVQSLQGTLSFVVGDAPCSWYMLEYEYKRLSSTLNARLAAGEGFVYIAPSVKEPVADAGYLHMVETCKRETELLRAYLETGNSDAFHKKLEQIFRILLELFESSQGLGRELAVQLNLFFLSCRNRQGLAAGEDGDSLRELDRMLEADIAVPLPLQSYMAMGDALFHTRAVSGQSLLRNCVAVVKDYIDAHLDGDISLTKLAEAAHFNPKYLSRIFGERTGVNLSDYIADKRLERAKALIADGSKKMQDISAAVGFLSPSYFTRFFKKSTGMTPQQYQDYIANQPFGEKVDKG